MNKPFDAYYNWLGIPPREQPPHYYRLLSLDPFEDNADAIEHAADRQMLHVRTFQSGPYAAQSQTLLNELAAARACLLDEDDKRQYDRRLRETFDRKATRAAAETVLPPPPAKVASTGESQMTPPPPNGVSQQAAVTSTPSAGPSASVPHVVAPTNTPPINRDSSRRPPPRSAHASAPADTISAEPKRLRRRRKQSILPVTLFVGGVVAILIALFAIAGAAGLFSPHRNQIAHVGPQDNSDRPAIATPADRSGDLKQRNHSTVRRKNGEFRPPEKKSDTNFGKYLTSKSAGDDADDSEETEQVALTLTTDPPVAAAIKPVSPKPRDAEPVVAEPAKAAVPAGDQLDAAMKAMQEIYAEKIDKVKTSQEKAALAHLLLKDAGDVAMSPDVRWVVLDAAYQTALEIGDFNQARKAVESIVADYDVDALQRRSELLEEGAKTATNEAGYREVAVATHELIPRLIAAQRFATARQLANRAENIAWQQLRDAPLRKSLQASIIEVRLRENQWNVAQQAKTALAANPSDPAANLTYGRYLAAIGGDWENGLKLLAKSGDAQWQTAAEQDLSTPATSAEQAATADAWRKLAEGSPEFPGLWARAQRWYERAQATAPAAEKTSIQARLDEIGGRHLDPALLAAAELPAPIAPPSPPPRDPPTKGQRTSVTLQYVLRGHEAQINDLAFSADGKWLASVADDASLRLWNAELGNSHFSIEAHDTQATHVAISSDGATIATAGDEAGKKVIRIWNAKLDRLGAIDSHSSGLLMPAFMPDGKELVAATGDHVVKLFDLDGVRQDVFYDHTNPVCALAVSPDGKLLASAGDGTSIKLFDLAGRRLLHSIDTPADPVIAIDFSADSVKLAAATEKGVVHVMQAAAPAAAIEFDAGNVSALAFISGGRGIAIAGEKQLAFWDTDTGSLRAKLPTHGGMISALAVSAGGGQLASAGLDNDGAGHVIKVWHVRLVKPTTADADK